MKNFTNTILALALTLVSISAKAEDVVEAIRINIQGEKAQRVYQELKKLNLVRFEGDKYQNVFFSKIYHLNYPGDWLQNSGRCNNVGTFEVRLYKKESNWRKSIGNIERCRDGSAKPLFNALMALGVKKVQNCEASGCSAEFKNFTLFFDPSETGANQFSIETTIAFNDDFMDQADFKKDHPRFSSSDEGPAINW